MTEIEISKLREECGVFGIYGHSEAARLTYLGLYALQHRGQESCGIVASDGAELRQERKMGHVSDAFDQTHLATVQRLVDRASPRIAALLERERQGADGVLLAADWHRLTTTSDDAMLALDSDRRMLSMNGAARALLSLPGQSFVFGHPVDQPQAHLWPLGSATLSHAVRPLLDRLARGEAPLEIEIALGEATRGVVTCAASEVGAGDYPRGTVITLACHQSAGGLADPGGNA